MHSHWGGDYVSVQHQTRAVVKSTFVESKTSPCPKRFESESKEVRVRVQRGSSPSPSPNETVKTEKEKNLLQNHILNY